MTEKKLVIEMKNDINQKIDLVDIPVFLRDDVCKVLDWLNYYKLSNLYKNIDIFLEHLVSLQKQYMISLRTLVNKDRTEKGILIKNLNIKTTKILKNFTIDDLKHIEYYLPKMEIRNIVKNYIVWSLATANHREALLNIKHKISKLQGIRLKISTILNLSVLEYTNSPSRVLFMQKIKR